MLNWLEASVSVAVGGVKAFYILHIAVGKYSAFQRYDKFYW